MITQLQNLLELHKVNSINISPLKPNYVTIESNPSLEDIYIFPYMYNLNRKIDDLNFNDIKYSVENLKKTALIFETINKKIFNKYPDISKKKKLELLIQVIDKLIKLKDLKFDTNDYKIKIVNKLDPKKFINIQPSLLKIITFDNVSKLRNTTHILTLQHIYHEGDSKSTSLDFYDFFNERNKNVTLKNIFEDASVPKTILKKNDWVIVTGHNDGRGYLHTTHLPEYMIKTGIYEKKFSPSELKKKILYFYDSVPKNILFYNCSAYQKFCKLFEGENNINIYCFNQNVCRKGKLKREIYFNKKYKLYKIKFNNGISSIFWRGISLESILNKIADNTLEHYMEAFGLRE
jgi:hypothetical protein